MTVTKVDKQPKFGMSVIKIRVSCEYRNFMTLGIQPQLSLSLLYGTLRTNLYHKRVYWHRKFQMFFKKKFMFHFSFFQKKMLPWAGKKIVHQKFGLLQQMAIRVSFNCDCITLDGLHMIEIFWKIIFWFYLVSRWLLAWQIAQSF